jgi:hypothetical protein
MMWLARLKPLAAVTAALLLATAVQGRQQPAPEGAREQTKTAPPPAGGAAAPDLTANRALAKQQLAVIDVALAELNQRVQDGKANRAAPPFTLWERRRMETLRRAGAGKAEMVAALEKYVDGLKGREAIAQELYQNARLAHDDVCEIQYRRMEAEIWLNEEKAR